VASSKPKTGPSILLIVLYLAFAIIGLYALYGLLQSNSGGLTIVEVLYAAVAAMAIGFVVFSLARVRRNYSLMNPPPNRVYEIVKCPQCSFKQVKNFAIGDYVTKSMGLCTQCNVANLFIDGIYGEGPQRK
jgi:hypothetical protein